MTNFKSIEKVIITHGWMLVRSNSSHYLYMHSVNSSTITIPNRGDADLSIDVIKNLEKTTGLSLRR